MHSFLLNCICSIHQITSIITATVSLEDGNFKLDSFFFMLLKSFLKLTYLLSVHLRCHFLKLILKVLLTERERKTN